jgi:hypothetical protein
MYREGSWGEALTMWNTVVGHLARQQEMRA